MIREKLTWMIDRDAGLHQVEELGEPGVLKWVDVMSKPKLLDWARGHMWSRAAYEVYNEPVYRAILLFRGH